MTKKVNNLMKNVALRRYFLTWTMLLTGLSMPLQPVRGAVSISMTYPAAATPCDSLSVTTKVVNTGATLSQLMVNELLPGGSSYQYVTNSLQITVSGGVTITNEASVLTQAWAPTCNLI